MRLAVITILLASFALSSCDEKDDPRRIQVRYEVVTTGNAWFGEYITVTGQKICNCSQPLLPSGWTHSFGVENTPFTLHIDATVDGFVVGDPAAPDITTRIYVDDELVSTNTNNWGKGYASADYVID